MVNLPPPLRNFFRCRVCLNLSWGSAFPTPTSGAVPQLVQCLAARGSGLVSNNAMCFPHWYGIGDHRVFVLVISATSLFGGEFPTISTPTARSLNCKISRIRNQYCLRLSLLAKQHKMEEKLRKLELTHSILSTTQLQPYHNKWDNEWGELMASSERSCCKFRSCAIEYSPTMGQWLKRRSILKWILKWHDGRVPDTRNLCRAAR